MGAPDPRVATADAASKLTGLTDAARAHWAYQPVKQPAGAAGEGRGVGEDAGRRVRPREARSRTG